MTDTITILDAHTLNPGDISWQPIESLGHMVAHDRTNNPDDLIPRIGDARIVLTNKTVLDAQTLANIPNTQYVGVLATGVNVVDLPAATAAGITVTNIPGYSAPSVAQHVFALLLELVTKSAAHDSAVRDSKTGWHNCPDFSFTVAPITELAGKTIGIVGLGDIGQNVASIAHGFGMNIIAYNGGRTNKTLPSHIPFEWTDIDTLFATADVITLHCPLTDDTKNLVGGKRLASMKPTSYIINTGRGPLIDEPALTRALADQKIAGAGLDVLSTEPPSLDNPLLTAPNCIITPHIAWASTEARRRLMQIAADNIAAFQNGTPQNVVNQ